MYEKRVGLTTKATAIIVIVILVVVGGAAAYYYTLPTTTPPSQRGIIKVGFSISQTGNFNVEGGKSLAGIQAAAKWVNDNGGVTVGGKAYNISLVYYDDASTTGNIVPLYTKLITQDGAQFLLAPYSSGLTAAAAPLADQYKLIMLSHGGASDSIWTKGYKNVFGVLSPASGYLKTAIDYLKANHPTDKLAFLYANDAFSTVVGAAASNYAKSQGLDVVYNSSYPGTTTDLSPQLTAAKAAGADDVLGGGHFNDGLLIMHQLNSVGWTPKFVSLLVAVTEPQFQSQLGASANLVTGPSQWETTVNYSPSTASTAGITYFGPTEAQFTSYYAKYDTTGPTYHSGEAGASIIVLADAIQTANSMNTTLVASALHGLHIMTFFGQFQVDSTGKQTAHAMVLDQWQSGTLVVVAPSTATSGSVEYPYTGS
ncbi:MAG: amino acid ABC transporter substrate-binding protein [Thaumarchaeota archaeon]|nr:amino acid ABC transporter substrate-binding protein [Nitrososphaerota archaeon]